MQREAPQALPALDQAASSQRFHAFQHPGAWLRRGQHRQQYLQAHRLAHNRQPQQDRLLEVREAVELLAQQLTHPAKDHLALLQERSDLAAKKLHDGLCYDFQGQGIARVRLDQLRVFRRGACDTLFCQQLFASVGIQPGEAQGAHRSPAALQWHEVARFLPAGEKQATPMFGLGHPAQQLRVALVARAHMTRALAFLQQDLQIVQHQQDTGTTQILQKEAQASFEAVRLVAERLGGKHLEALIQHPFARGNIAQGAPDDHLEALRQPVHHSRRQHRLADAALS